MVNSTSSTVGNNIYIDRYIYVINSNINVSEAYSLLVPTVDTIYLALLYAYLKFLLNLKWEIKIHDHVVLD